MRTGRRRGVTAGSNGQAQHGTCDAEERLQARQQWRENQSKVDRVQEACQYPLKEAMAWGRRRGVRP